MATLQDISQETGLSLSTISHVLNGRPGFSDKTRKRVLAAAKKLNYKPNLLARGLRNSGGIQIVGMLWSLGRPEAQTIIRSVGQRLWRQGYAMQMHESMSHDAVVLDALEDLNRRGVEAVVVQHYPGMLDNEAIVEQLEKFKAVILVSINITDGAVHTHWDTVFQDAGPGIAQVMDYWAATGRKRPALLGNAQLLNKYAQPMEMFRSRLKAHGWPASDFIIDKGQTGEPGHFVNFYVDALDRQFAGQPFPYDAVLCVGDDGAAALHHWLGERGVEVGRDVSVIGYGNMEWTSTLRPQLSSIEPYSEQVAQTVTSMLFTRLGNPALSRQIKTVSSSFLWRASAGEAI